MMRTLSSIAALALSLYGSSAFPQTSAPPAQQPSKDVAATNDEALTKAVYAALEADPNHFFRHVTVRVDNGVATLGGFVHSSSSIYRARTIAGKVPGVTRVVTNNLQLEPNRPR
jgi:osmotically-inducible protein OsmY